MKLLTDVVAFTTGGLGGFGRTLIGLKKDGTLVTTGPIQEGNVMQFDQGQNNVDDWTDVIAIDSGEYHTIGLRNDGTVLATGLNNKGQCAVSDWTDVCEIACGPYTTVGLKKDGGVLVTGTDDSFRERLASLNDVKSVLVYEFSDRNTCVVCLKNDGTVSVESNDLLNSEAYIQDKLSKWTDIESIYFGYFPETSAMLQEIIYGIKLDGTVVWEVYNEAIHEDVENMIQEFGGLSFD